MEQTLDIDLVEAIEAACRAARPRPRQADLLRQLEDGVSHFHFCHGLTRNGWFRPGGLIMPSGEPVTDDVTRWAEAAWSLAGEDGARLLAACRGDGDEADLRAEIGLPAGSDSPIVTRLAGASHYLYASYGASPEAFVQLEVEELREVTSHRLADQGVPDDIEDLVTAPLVACEGRPVGMPVYRLRRVHDMARVMARMTLQHAGETAPAIRFLSDWARSRAAAKPLCEHWLLVTLDWRDRYGIERIGLKPLAVREHLRPPLPEPIDGVDLANALLDYDRQSGYPMAWYFDLVAGRGVSEALAHAVLAQWQEGFRYLPERDLACVADYCRRPYRA